MGKLPVLILTGFLGSGKTTLLNYILQEQRDMKIAVIENEFGEIPIDNELLQQNKLAMAEQIIVMDNGCVCCTIRSDLIEGLKQILQATQNGSPVDLICIETTGMADPVPIVKTFMSQPALTDALRLDGVVALADARNLPARLDDDIENGKVNEAFQQIAFADKIILNKLDLVSSGDAASCTAKIRNVNKFAKIVPAVRGRIDLKEVFDIRAHDMLSFEGNSFEKEDDASFQCVSCTDVPKPKNLVFGKGGNINRHDSRVNSFAVTKEGEMLPAKLDWWFPMVADAKTNLPLLKGTIFRIKGILSIQGESRKRIFHAVMDSSDGEWGPEWAEDEKRSSKIVFIGKSLDRRFLQGAFEECFTDEVGPCQTEVPVW